eukprot:7421002-Heterocapsa_arctica.AAC.1
MIVRHYLSAWNRGRGSCACCGVNARSMAIGPLREQARHLLPASTCMNTHCKTHARNTTSIKKSVADIIRWDQRVIQRPPTH